MDRAGTGRRRCARAAGASPAPVSPSSETLPATVAIISQLFATATWGFGLWWLAIAVSLLVRYLRAGGLPFHLGWWAFTFPLGAFTVAR